MGAYKKILAEDYQACLENPSRIIQTRMGPVEYAIRGEGPAVLSVHGGPGGYDQGLAVAECFRKNGFKVIAPSRPGYLGTPLGKATSPDGQAEILAALVEALGLETVLVVGASAGGPPSYALAQNHPEMVAALLEIDSVSLKYTKGNELSKTEEAMYLSKPGLWFMDWLMRHFPKTMVREFLKTESTLAGRDLAERTEHVVSTPNKLGFVQVMTKTMSDRWEERKLGVENDLNCLGGLDKMVLDKIVCPVLIFHGDADNDVPFFHAEYAKEAITGAELYTIRKGSHIGFWIADMAEEAQAYAVEWFREKVGENTLRSQ